MSPKSEFWNVLKRRRFLLLFSFYDFRQNISIWQNRIKWNSLENCERLMETNFVRKLLSFRLPIFISKRPSLLRDNQTLASKMFARWFCVRRRNDEKVVGSNTSSEYHLAKPHPPLTLGWSPVNRLFLTKLVKVKTSHVVILPTSRDVHCVLTAATSR